MTSFLLPSRRRAWAPIGLVFIAWGAVAACGGTTDSKNGDDNPAVGGGPASGGEPSGGGTGGGGNSGDGGGPASGGEPSYGGAGGDSCPGREIDGAAQTAAGGAIAFYCRDIECEGNCTGVYDCDQNIVCEDDEQIYCGIDGRSFVGNSNCAQWAVQYEGECELVNCDFRDVPCDAPAPTSFCGRAREVAGGQLGSCIPVPQCACSTDEECPDPLAQACTPQGHCDYRSRIPD